MKKNMKTTVAGLFAALAMMFAPQVSARIDGKDGPPITAGNYLPAVGLAALGYLASDKKEE